MPFCLTGCGSLPLAHPGPPRSAWRSHAALAGAALSAVLATAASCGGATSDIDSYPIAIGRAPLGAPAMDAGFDADQSADSGPPVEAGALVATAELADDPTGQSFPMVIDTASPITILAGASGTTPQTAPAGFDLLGADGTPGADASSAPVRARFRGWDVLQLPLQPIGDGSVLPQGVLGGDLLRSFSVEFRFGMLCPSGGSALCTSITFWSQLGADDGFLEDAGFAVIGFTLFGGGEVTANGDPDFLGLRGPLTVPPTRVVLRGCAVPNFFSPAVAAATVQPACCTATDAANQSTGVDLSLLVDTGVGPMVLSASAWARVAGAASSAALGLPPLPVATPVPAPPPLRIATWPTPIDVLLWAELPRYALVNLEAGVNDDPGPCVELARARRTEIVSYDTVMNPSLHTCGAPCDLDPNNSGEAQNSAAYLEVGGRIPVAVISDDEPFLQGLRFDVLPEGPEIDGLVGANALGRARMELDYPASSPRAVFSCEGDAPRTECWAAARCPQLPDTSSIHYCFGLGPHTLAATCAPSGC